MNDYMRENKIEPVPPQITAAAASRGAGRTKPADAGDAPETATR
jgi:hypothetical protein